MRIIGVTLLAVGIIGLLITGISYTTSETVVDAGPLQVEQEQERQIPFSPVAAGILIVVGGVLTVVGFRRSGTSDTTGTSNTSGTSGTSDTPAKTGSTDTSRTSGG